MLARYIRRRHAGTAAVAVTALVLAGLTVPTAAATTNRGISRDNGIRSFERLATFPVYEHSEDRSDVTVAEITAVSSNGETLISTDSPGERVTFTNITDPRHPVPDGTPGADVPNTLAVGGEPTSVAVYQDYALIAVDTSESFANPSGELVVVKVADRSVARTIELEGQPDSIAISPNGARGGVFAAIAIENERDEDVNDGAIPQLPGGHLVRMSLAGEIRQWTPEKVDLVTAATAAGLHAPTDLEPEYVAINARNQIALTLQENNGIAVIDAVSGTILEAFSAGSVDLTGIDTADDSTIDLTSSLDNVVREPDAIAWIGDGLVATANEGDLDGGSRGWSVFDVASGAAVWDSGNTVEELAVRVGLYPDDRSDNKGTEPEGIAVATFNGRPYAFIGTERGNFVAVYDVSNPKRPRFQQVLPATNGPEGLLPIPSRGLFVVSSEVDVPEDDVRSTITVYGADRGQPDFPTIESRDVGGEPQGWGALSALTADPKRSNRLWSVSDSYYSPTKLFAVSTSREPALINSSLTLTENGNPIGVDAEGLHARHDGGFWLAAEGASGPGNQILLLDSEAAVQQRIALPADVTPRLGSNGLEGITATGRGQQERVYVALQRPLSGEGNVARIGRYDVATGGWSWFGYPLETPIVRDPEDPPVIGLYEITALVDDSFAVIERDNQPGPDAQVKRIYRFDLPRNPEGDLPAVDNKKLVRDLLPVLQAANGWVQEKVEGLTIGRDGRIYIATDNDGVQDATGETLFADIGSQRQIFGR